jgi:hypothetical protein
MLSVAFFYHAEWCIFIIIMLTLAFFYYYADCRIFYYYTEWLISVFVTVSVSMLNAVS